MPDIDVSVDVAACFDIIRAQGRRGSAELQLLTHDPAGGYAPLAEALTSGWLMEPATFEQPTTLVIVEQGEITDSILNTLSANGIRYVAVENEVYKISKGINGSRIDGPAKEWVYPLEKTDKYP